MSYIYDGLRVVLETCYGFCGDLALAIVFFTFLSKVVLLPITIWVQKNSIKLVQMQPEINRIKVKFFGDRDAIADEEHEIYKRNGYNPFASMIPMFIQILLLICMIGAIHQVVDAGKVSLSFFGLGLDKIPAENGGMYVLMPLIAGLSAFALSVSQNKANILQAEQGKGMQYGTMAFSVGISLYLGFYVQVAVVIYWIASNLLSIVQQYIINYFINPKNYVDFDELEKTKKELEALTGLGKKKSIFDKDPYAKKEKADYKRFFSVVNKHLVFYSESSGFYKYFQGIIEYILNNSKITIHYITSDPEDQIFAISEKQPRIKAYYIAEKRLITLMMKMDADMVVMTMPDLENFHIKRSYVRKDIEYVFIPHSMCSLNLTMRKGSMDHYDTLFSSGIHQTEEALKTEEAYGLKKRRIVEWGYCLLDQMRSEYAELKGKAKRAEAEAERAEDFNENESNVKSILIAPSWQNGNIIDSCLEDMLESLKGKGYHVTVRPHPQHVRHQPEKMQQLKERYAADDDIEIQTDFSSNDTVFLADMMITDWSGIAYEYSFTTYKPVIFVDTPLKIMNPEYQKIDTEPFNIWIRERLGSVVPVEDAAHTDRYVADILNHIEDYRSDIEFLARTYVYNLDNSAEVGAKYIIERLKEIVAAKKSQ